MKFIYKYKLLFIAMLCLTACDDITDLNVDPNNPTTARPNEVLTSAEGYIGFLMDSQFNDQAFLWAQYWVWGPGVSLGDGARFILEPSDANQVWGRAYNNVLADLQYLNNSGDNAYSGIAKVLEAYTYNYLVDHFGDIPYSEAIRATEGILTPKFDDDEAIYTDLISKLDAAIAELSAPGTTSVGNEDYVYHGDFGNWIRFANSLKLRLLMRQANVKDVGDQVRSLLGSGVFIENSGQMAQIQYLGTSGSENPMFAWEESGIGLFYKAADAACNILRANNDPRLFAFYKEAVNFPGEIISAKPHEIALDFGAIDEDWSDPSDIAYSAASSVVLMSDWETWFLRAEAAARYGVGDANAAFVNAVDANFNFLHLSGGADFANTLGFADAADMNAQLDLIGIQKYTSMNGIQEAEGWITTRLFDRPESRIFSQEILETPSASALPENVFPSIWPYSADEVSSNGANVPARGVDVTAKVFWDN